MMIATNDKTAHPNYDGDNEVGEYSATVATLSTSFTTSPYISSLFFNGTNIDEPIATWKFNSATNTNQIRTRYLFIPDSLGSITALSGAVSPGDGQSTIASYAYDSYGNLAAICGGDIATQNLFRYTAREYTPLPDITGYSQLPNSLYHFRARTDDVQLGTFLQQDSVWSDNLYPYVNGNPVMYNDPRGEYPFESCVKFIQKAWKKHEIKEKAQDFALLIARKSAGIPDPNPTSILLTPEMEVGAEAIKTTYKWVNEPEMAPNKTMLLRDYDMWKTDNSHIDNKYRFMAWNKYEEYCKRNGIDSKEWNSMRKWIRAEPIYWDTTRLMRGGWSDKEIKALLFAMEYM